MLLEEKRWLWKGQQAFLKSDLKQAAVVSVCSAPRAGWLLCNCAAHLEGGSNS